MMRMLSSMQKMIKRGKGNREEIGEVEAVKAAGLDGGVSSIGFGQLDGKILQESKKRYLDHQKLDRFIWTSRKRMRQSQLNLKRMEFDRWNRPWEREGGDVD